MSSYGNPTPNIERCGSLLALMLDVEVRGLEEQGDGRLDTGRNRRMKVAFRRYAAIDPLLAGDCEWGEKGFLLAQLSEQSGKSISTLKRYIRQVKQAQGDPTALAPKAERTDKGQVRAMKPEWLELAVALREEAPGRSTRQIIEILEKSGEVPVEAIKRSTLDRHLRGLGKTRQFIRKDKRVYQRYEKKHRNVQWIMDFCLPRLYVEGEQVYVLVIIDDHSRLCGHIEAYFHQDILAVEDGLKKAFLRCGIPTSLYDDNGSAFVSQFLTGALLELGIVHRHSRPGEPAGRGKVERMIQTFQDSFVPEMALRYPYTLADINRALWAWVDQSYHQRVHSETLQTPRERFDTDTQPLRFYTPEQLEAAFMQRVTRTVTKTALVKLEGNTYAADRTLAGQKVEVRYKPGNLQSIQIWRDGRFIHVASPHERPEDIDFTKSTQPASVSKQTGLNLLDLCEQERRASLKERVAQIRNRAQAHDRTGFTTSQCAKVIAEKLGRTLRDPEIGLVARTWELLGGMTESLVCSAMDEYIRTHGHHTHISFYLDAIYKHHINERRSRHD